MADERIAQFSLSTTSSASSGDNFLIDHQPQNREGAWARGAFIIPGARGGCGDREPYSPPQRRGNFVLWPALTLCLEVDMDDPRTEQYLANAKRCEEYAQGSDDRLLANMYEDMARKWRELAAQVEEEEVVVAQ